MDHERNQGRHGGYGRGVGDEHDDRDTYERPEVLRLPVLDVDGDDEVPDEGDDRRADPEQEDVELWTAAEAEQLLALLAHDEDEGQEGGHHPEAEGHEDPAYLRWPEVEVFLGEGWHDRLKKIMNKGYNLF